MKQFFVLVGFVVGTVLAVNVNVQIEFENFKQKFGKSYESEFEEVMRMGIFAENLEFCENHNAKYEKGEVTYSVAINHLSDLLPHEFGNGFKFQNMTNVPEITENNLNYVDLPAEIDWRQKGVVSEVKQQGECMSCWAFSTTGATESHYAIATGRLISLSEQQLVDCEPDFGGCKKGGFPSQAMQYVQTHGGLMSEAEYPYTSQRGTSGACRFKPQQAKIQIKGVVNVPGNEQSLQSAVVNGPVSVGINADDPGFKHWHDGVYNNPNCNPNPNHAVLVVGYGTDRQSGLDYWLVKNSWGAGFGVNGYIKMARNKNNQCGIAKTPCYPKV